MKQASLDWSKLPQTLRYLAQPAEKYGAFQFDERIFQFLETEMTVQDKEELLALSKLTARDNVAIEQWLDEFTMVKHRESALVYFLGHLMCLAHDNGFL